MGLVWYGPVGRNAPRAPVSVHSGAAQQGVDRNEPGVARLAERQRGLITREQLLALGFSDRAIARAVAAGRLHRVHRGVYLVGYAVMLPLAHEEAALLAVGAGATLSHHSAAGVWGFATPDDAVHVTAAGRRPRHRRGIRTHHAPLPPSETRTRHGLRLTSPSRTLDDLASFLAPAAHRRATDEAEGLGLIPVTTDKSGMTRSEAERRLIDLLHRAGLPPTATNTKLHGHEVDVLYEPQRLVLEMDGFAYHRTRTQAHRDHVRDATLLAHGYRVLRIGWHQITDAPEALVADIARALARTG
jgi:very-short-patch-repair endonuclease